MAPLIVFMQVSNTGIGFIKMFEGCRLRSYRDPVGIWTIGYGSITYPSGRKVGPGERISQELAEVFLEYEISLKAKAVNALNLRLNQGQFNALVSFAYNLGIGALRRSTLLRKVKLNQDDPTIEKEFMRWNRAGNKVLAGLTRRRKAESEMYFGKTPISNLYPVQ